MSESHSRSFALLEHKPSDARVLNLRRTATIFAGRPELAEQPFFRNAGLNRSIIIKHHLRPSELADFDQPRVSATKVVLPIDQGSLRSGAKSFFVGQRDSDALIGHEFGLRDPEDADLRLLALLDGMRSFDPFLLRAELALHNVHPAPCYFELPQATLARITAFVEGEISPIVDAAFKGSAGHGGSLTRKLLSDSLSGDFGPFQQTLQISADEFGKVLLSWKAVIYFKYQLLQMADGLRDLRHGLENLSPTKRGRREDHEQITLSRNVLRRVLKAALQDVSTALGAYDRAYRGLVQRSDAAAFRAFLREAPAWSDRLGAAVGVVDHLVSFWLYHFPFSRRANLSADSLAASFQAFEMGVRSTIDQPQTV
jgi:hypothetical protein